jgi:DNA ligase-1
MKILKKLDSKNKVRVWYAEAVNDQIVVTHGLEGGQLITESTTAVPKNVGRSNATSAEQQAEVEVKALYAKKLDRDGYKENLADSAKFIAPMLARDYSKLAHQVPDKDLYVSAKLDGVRCTWDPARKTLVSRKGLTYSVPHIESALQDCKLPLDGELYLHGYPLNEIVSAVKKPNDLSPNLEYRVFDMITDNTFDIRLFLYDTEVRRINNPKIVAVAQFLRPKSFIQDLHDKFVRDGYEGAMIRDPDFPYEIGIRSKSLFKYKEFEEAEYLVTSVSEDKEGGAVLGCSISKTPDVDFSVRCRGTDQYRAWQLAHADEIIGQLVTVRYQTLTPFNIPQFPVGIALRNYE